MYICLWADGGSGFLGPLSHKDGRYASVRAIKSLIYLFSQLRLAYFIISYFCVPSFVASVTSCRFERRLSATMIRKRKRLLSLFFLKCTVSY